MRKMILIITSLVLLILFVPFMFVTFILPTPGDASKDTGQASPAEPFPTISAYVVDEDKVIEMPFGDYLKGVVAAEMPASFNSEALKAQAVAARSYILTRAKGYERDGTPPEHKGAMTCTDPNHCKAWLSQEDLKEKWGEDWINTYWPKITEAVDTTTGVIMTYGGEPVNAVFHSTSSGHTENSKDVWGGDVPYLHSVDSPGDESSPKFLSESDVSVDDFKAKILSVKPEAIWQEGAPLITDAARSDAGGLISVTTGGVSIKGTEFRTLFGLNSTNVEFSEKEGFLTMHVKGNGHGVGMSQYGANYLAGQGMGYEDILKTYYTGVEVGVYKP